MMRRQSCIIFITYGLSDYISLKWSFLLCPKPHTNSRDGVKFCTNQTLWLGCQLDIKTSERLMGQFTTQLATALLCSKVPQQYCNTSKPGCVFTFVSLWALCVALLKGNLCQPRAQDFGISWVQTQGCVGRARRERLGGSRGGRYAGYMRSKAGKF